MHCGIIIVNIIMCVTCMCIVYVTQIAYTEIASHACDKLHNIYFKGTQNLQFNFTSFVILGHL